MLPHIPLIRGRHRNDFLNNRKLSLCSCPFMSCCHLYLHGDKMHWGALDTEHPGPLTEYATWWHHRMETFSALLALCAGNSPVTGEFPSQRIVTQSIDVFSDLPLNKRLSKLSWGLWFETPPCPLWRHCNEYDELKEGVFMGSSLLAFCHDNEYVNKTRVRFYCQYSICKSHCVGNTEPEYRM